MANVSAQVKVKGGKALVKKLRKLAGEVSAEETLIAASKKGAEPIKDAAKRIVPVRTGTLRDSIVIEEFKERGRFVGAGVFSAPGKGRGSRRTFYAHMVEFGTVHSAPHPFLRPAFDEQKKAALKIVRSELGAAVERASR